MESTYEFPSRELTLALSLLDTDLRRCYSHIKKASNLYQKEVALALRYNRIKPALDQTVDTKATSISEEYKTAIVKGNYTLAKKYID